MRDDARPKRRRQKPIEPSLFVDSDRVGLTPKAAKSARLQQSRDQGHEAQTYKNEDSPENKEYVSPAFHAAILGTLRAMISEEVAKQKQEHADHEDWSTKPFWIMFGLNGLLVIVGGAYTIVPYRQLSAIKAQAKDFALSQRAQVSVGRPDGVTMELVPPAVGKRLTVKMFFLNSGSVTAEQFFAQTMVGYRSGKSVQMPEGHTLEAEPWR